MLFFAILIKVLAGSLHFVPWRTRLVDSFWTFTLNFILFTKENVLVTSNWNTICLRFSEQSERHVLYNVYIEAILIWQRNFIYLRE